MKKYLVFLGLICLAFIAPRYIPGKIKAHAPLPAANNFPLDSAVLQSAQFSEESMKLQWLGFTKDKGWGELLSQVEAKGFKRIERASWGFKGVLKNNVTGKAVDVMFCAFDFYNPSAIGQKSFQTCSMIWRKVGNDVYKAYIVFPKGVQDREKSFALAEEWFADATGTVQKAHSFNKCFNRCINGGRHSVAVKTIFGSMTATADCKSQCITGVVACGGVTAILELASGGLGTPVLIATFGICAGVTCGECFAMCALGCA